MVVDLNKVAKDLSTVTGREWSVQQRTVGSTTDPSAPPQEKTYLLTTMKKHTFPMCDLLESGPNCLNIAPSHQVAHQLALGLFNEMLEKTRLSHIDNFPRSLIQGLASRIPPEDKITPHENEFVGSSVLPSEIVTPGLARAIAREALLTRTLQCLGRNPIHADYRDFDTPYTNEEIEQIPAILEKHYDIRAQIDWDDVRLIKPWQIDGEGR